MPGVDDVAFVTGPGDRGVGRVRRSGVAEVARLLLDARVIDADVAPVAGVVADGAGDGVGCRMALHVGTTMAAAATVACRARDDLVHEACGGCRGPRGDVLSVAGAARLIAEGG